MSEQTIEITCEGCNETFTVIRDKDAPEDAISMRCNWCPNCEERAQDYYKEWYNYPETSTV